MQTFLRVTGPLWGESTGQRWIPLTKASDAEISIGFFFDLRLTNGWANNRDAGDLRLHHAHYDVTVMIRPQEIAYSGFYDHGPNKLASSLQTIFCIFVDENRCILIQISARVHVNEQAASPYLTWWYSDWLTSYGVTCPKRVYDIILDKIGFPQLA